MPAATQIYSFAVTIPAGTDTTTLFVQDCSFPPASVVTIRWKVPPGPSGFMGFAITSDTVPVIPLQQDTFIITDDDSASWDIQGYPDAGNWQVTGYNNDSYDHTVYLDFLTVPPGQDAPAPQTSIATAPVIDDSALTPAEVQVSDLIAGISVQS